MCVYNYLWNPNESVKKVEENSEIPDIRKKKNELFLKEIMYFKTLIINSLRK